MTLEHIYYIGQTIAVIVIVATLIAILWQGFQTNKIARADLTLSVWMQTGAMNQSLVDSEDKAAFITRLFDPNVRLSPEDKTRVTFQMHTQIGVYQAAHNLRGRGLIEQSAYDLIGSGVRGFLLSPVARKWWRSHRGHGYDKAFCEIIDAMIVEIEGKTSAAAEKEETQS
ncbi:MAG: hypothetical protein R3C60_05520 [Parvularculaceae bacterium]